MPNTVSTVELRRLLWVGPLTIIAATFGVLIVRLIGVAIVRPSPAFPHLAWLPPTVFTILLVICAVLVFTLVARFTKRPYRTYFVISVVVLVLSFIPDAAEPIYALVPGANWPNAILLMVLHVLAWGITVSMLFRLTKARTN
jgi:membrane-associated HD superfamily phosphohydrolase